MNLSSTWKDHHYHKRCNSDNIDISYFCILWGHFFHLGSSLSSSSCSSFWLTSTTPTMTRPRSDPWKFDWKRYCCERWDLVIPCQTKHSVFFPQAVWNPSVKVGNPILERCQGPCNIMLHTKLLLLRVLWLSHLFEVSKLSWSKAFQQNWPWRPGRGPHHEKPLCFNYRRIRIGPANYFFHFPPFLPTLPIFCRPLVILGGNQFIFSSVQPIRQHNTPAQALASPQIMHGNYIREPLPVTQLTKAYGIIDGLHWDKMNMEKVEHLVVVLN